VYCMSYPAHPSWFRHRNITWRVQIMKLFVIYFILFLLSHSKFRYSHLLLHHTCSSYGRSKAHISFCSSFLIFHVWVGGKF
jgi:hypothetical protein